MNFLGNLDSVSDSVIAILTRLLVDFGRRCYKMLELFLTGCSCFIGSSHVFSIVRQDIKTTALSLGVRRSEVQILSPRIGESLEI